MAQDLGGIDIRILSLVGKGTKREKFLFRGSLVVRVHDWVRRTRMGQVLLSLQCHDWQSRKKGEEEVRARDSFIADWGMELSKVCSFIHV